MKKIILLSIIINCTLLYSQESELPVKKDNLIICEMQKANTELYDDFIIYLIDNGYKVEEENKDRLTFQTIYKDMKYLKNYKHLLYFRIKDNRLFISGKWKLNMTISLGGVSTENSEYEWYYTPSKSTAYGKQHTEIIEIIKGYCKDCKILYKKQ
jgi:hypothetical protein